MGFAPFGIGHFAAVRLQPDDVLDPRTTYRATLKKMPAPQNRVLAAQPDHAYEELKQLPPVGRGGPVEPGDFVVLAVRVVVATLRASDLVAAEDHRHPLRKHQRGYQIAF